MGAIKLTACFLYSVNITVYATNLYFLKTYPSYMKPRCALGMQGDDETGAAVAVLNGYISADGSAVVCPTPDTSFGGECFFIIVYGN